MTCAVIREQLVETARGRELSSDLRAIVFEHAAHCSACAEHLELQQRLSAVFSEVALRCGGAPKRIEDVLLRQLPLPIRRRRLRVWEWTGGVAAAAALAVGFIWLQHPIPVPKDAATDQARSGFVALPFAEETSAEEQTDVVRVSLSGESLLAMGIPVSSDLLDQQVQADVEIGMDGTARAIRLTNQEHE
jgi:anti-sigma factor RsiW